MPRRPRRPPSLFRVDNPKHRWHSTSVEWLEAPPRQDLEVFEDASRTILSKNTSPDISFTWSVNPYRGCTHACAYCYARPTHEYLDFGAGSDFDRKIVLKPKAPELLAAAFDKPSWKGELVVFSGNTDCYQPLEATWELTRRCLEVCADYRNPVSIITKSTVIERDIDVLLDLSWYAHCIVTISIPFHNPDTARAIEPGVPTPQRRYKTVQRLAEAGVIVGVNVAPIIPGLNDEDAVQVLEASKAAGASYAGFGMVRLPGPVADVFPKRLREAFPLRADKVMSQLRQCRGGALNDSRFGQRMRGAGPRWGAVATMVDTARRRLGLTEMPRAPEPTTFRRPDTPTPKTGDDRQLDLFG